MATEHQLDQFLITGGGMLHIDGDWPDPDQLIGQQLGAFKLVEVLGSGGMATVFRGERADQDFEQHVAIKIIHAGLTDALLRDRFLQERQILARLNHPNIARVFDGGVTADGRPFLVMELIDGLPLDQWCEQQELGIADRLRLIESVAGAVQYAHSQFVAHRDLKPANILVDEHGAPRLLDFGVASLLNNDSDIDSDIDTGNCGVFTPLYAAPEQLRGEAVGMAADIYQLGVVIYQLLTNRSPYGDVVGIDAAELRHRILDEHIPLMSWADRDLDHASKLRGELDAIVARCLQATPTDRYPAAASLIDDLRAWRQLQPVSVMPASRSYPLRKFLQRQRLPALLAAGFVVVIVGVSSWYLQSLTVARQEAELAAERAGAVAGFLEGLLRAFDPIKGGGAQGFNTLITQAGSELANSAAVENEVKHEVLALLAETLLDRGDFAAVIAMLEPISDDALPNQYRANYLSLLGYAHYRNGNLPRGRDLMTDSFEIQNQGERSLPLAMTMERMALLERRSGNYQKARELAEQALQIKQDKLPAGDVQISTARNSLALSLQEMGEYQAAAAQFRKAVDAYRNGAEASSLRIAMTLSNLADVQRSLGQFEQAVQHATEAVELARSVREDNPQLLATALTTLGNVRFAEQQLPLAIASYEEALGIYRSTLGEQHPRLIAPGYNRALALKQSGDCAAAVVAIEPIQRLAKQALEAGHPQLVAIARLADDCSVD